ncbi:transposase [Kibdelosporangium philippinense]|uniref:Transposase n=1 Tax=Kibdelosporangium philippinense TaxID=211113 RepID=A0ABS8ZAK8_9PSEU|nr:transposase [Kibdelosporangium philippinense]MCE7004547.1 transposase [Kibdelosporangium philippinense]
MTAAQDFELPINGRLLLDALHLATEQRQRLLSLVITAGQRGDSPQFQVVLGRIRVARAVGRPRTRPDRVLADKAYGSRVNREYLRRRGIRCTIPDKTDQARHRKTKGRPVADHQPSTRSSTSSATPWSAGSTDSNATVQSRQGMTSSPSATAAQVFYVLDRPASCQPRHTPNKQLGGRSIACHNHWGLPQVT